MSIESRYGRIWLAAAACNGFLTVALGAFAAHGLTGRLSERLLGAFEKGVEYQGMHALALLCVGLLLLHQPNGKFLRWAGTAFMSGIMLFSGSLYLLALSGVGAWGMITPFGGMAFLSGWVLLGLGAWQMGKDG